jgi:hypothetical protein
MGSPISSAELRKRRSDWHRTGLIISTSDYTKSPAVQIKVVLHQDPDSVSSTGCPVDPVVGCLFGLLKVVSSG